MNLLFGHDKTVAEWAAKKFRIPVRPWNFAVGVLDKNGVLIGAALFHNHNGSNIELSFFGPGSVAASVVHGLAKFAFDSLQVCRVSALTPRSNKKVIRALPRLGFRMEGVAKHYYGPVKKQDAIMFGLLAENGRKLMGGRP